MLLSSVMPFHVSFTKVLTAASMLELSQGHYLLCKACLLSNLFSGAYTWHPNYEDHLNSIRFLSSLIRKSMINHSCNAVMYSWCSTAGCVVQYGWAMTYNDREVVCYACNMNESDGALWWAAVSRWCWVTWEAYANMDLSKVHLKHQKSDVHDIH